MSVRRPASMIAALMILAGCGSDAPVVRPPASAASPQETAEPPVAAPGVDLTRLPLGDGRISTEAERGAAWACETAFGGPAPGGARPWIGEDQTFDLTAKPIVEGAFDWPEAFTATVEGETRTLSGNGLPSHPTGVFPVPPGSDAFAHDPNPNRVAAQTLLMEVPAAPEVAAEASCTPPGPIGVLLTGSVFMNALDAAGRDAVAHEVQDGCQGHPQQAGVYHYHSLTTCFDEGETGHSPLVGYALDGFGLFGHRGENGAALTNRDLDRCHGHRHAVAWDGGTATMYHYHATRAYPYTVGCFRGVPGPPPIGV